MTSILDTQKLAWRNFFQVHLLAFRKDTSIAGSERVPRIQAMWNALDVENKRSWAHIVVKKATPGQ